ncbi:MAG: very short patch repair endonuclease [Actinomycetota bacterium]
MSPANRKQPSWPSSYRPAASSERVRSQLSGQRQRDTAPEMAIRHLLHSRGLRYRVNVAPVSGVRCRADMVFPGARVAVFVDGCFWHGCPTHGTVPKANAEWWRSKLDRNVQRDHENDERLRAEGWAVIRVWEHEDPGAASARISAIVRRRARRRR